MKTELVAQGKANHESLSASLSKAVGNLEFDCLEVAVAYATKQGIRVLEQALVNFPQTSRWVVGLDDAITQPEALEFLMALPGAEVRVAALAPQRRFHPKLYFLSSSTNSGLGLTVVGSGNMTQRGFRQNGETAVLLTAENPEEVAAMRQQWHHMWNLGGPATKAILDTYRENYLIARKARKTIEAIGAAPKEPKPDAPIAKLSVFDGNPATAVTAWTESGSPSAGGRDLELPRALMPFFGLANSPTTKRFRMQNQAIFALTFTERADNQMWRLLLSRVAIEAGIGRENLRPLTGGNRSDLALVFSRTNGDADYSIEIVVINSVQHKAIVDASTSVGGLQRTRDPGGRQFGFY